MSEPIANRYDFVLFFDVENGNPNGDPDAGNSPRIDAETGIGIVSDVCIKRKVRNYIELIKDGAQGYEIYVREAAILNDQNKRAYDNLGMTASNKLPKNMDERQAVTQFMCANFFDIRAFGAVMTTEVNCGQVRGPIQLCFAQSVEPVMPAEMSITRMAVTNAKDADKERTMGRKQYVPYGLYRLEGFVSAPLAQKTGFSCDDMELFWEALMNMFENDRSAARGLMTSRKLVIFKHDSKIGQASSRKLFDLVQAIRTADGVARRYEDYSIAIDSEALPHGVTLEIRD